MRHVVIWTVVVVLLALGSGAGLAGAQARGRQGEIRAALEARGITRHADIAYDAIVGVDPARLSLDVYTTAGLEQAPVVLFIHGGSWQRGDKRAVLRKPLRFVPDGFVVVSANYRFRPLVDVATMAGDVARAVGWITREIETYGGDPEQIFLMGHSAGAHLVAVVGTNEAFLEHADVSFDRLAGVIPLDTGPYNVEKRLARNPAGSNAGRLARLVFGDDPARWPAVSPVHNIEPGKGIPPFLVFHSDGRRDVPRQARPFVEALDGAGIEAKLVRAAGKTHGTLNQDMGRAGEEPTELVMEFLRAHSGS